MVFVGFEGLTVADNPLRGCAATASRWRQQIQRASHDSPNSVNISNACADLLIGNDIAPQFRGCDVHAAYTKAMADPAIRRRIIEVHAEPAVSTPAALRDFMHAEAKKWGELSG
jgi:hypothetical protein